MLNRIYIVVGIFAIVVLAGAFIAPRFIQWGDYRDRMEVLASDVLGAEVTIRGDIAFSLLPSPRLEFSDVVVGDAESPVATVAGVEAEFALMDFLRDIYTITALSLDRPVVDLVLDENGLFSTGVDIAGSASGVALGHARIANGSIRLTDLRADEMFVATRLDGDLRLSSFSGPFQFQGAADYDGRRYELRFNTGASDAEGNARITSFVRESGGAFSINAEGMLAAGIAPKFDGTLVYRQTPPASANAEDVRGDLLFDSKIAISTDRVLISGYTLHPDESRAGIRLTGTGSIQLGLRRSFAANVSGGVFSLPPRPATEIPAQLPYEFVRLLSELPAPPIPPMPGTLDIDLAEVTLRGFSLRELRLDASSDGAAWTIEQAVARLAGDSDLRLSGRLENDDGNVGFSGDVAINTARLDALAQLWRRPREDNPLFNLQGGLEGRVMLAGDAFGLSNGRLSFAGQTHGFELRIGFGSEPRLDTALHLGNLDAAQTAALVALAPDVASDGSFNVSFPDGSFSLTARAIEVLGLPAADLVAEGQWSPQATRFSRLATSDWGGVSLGTTLRLSGALTALRATASGQIAVDSAEAPGLAAIYELAGVPFGWQQGLEPAWPAQVQFILSDNDQGAGQVLTLAGNAAEAALDLRAEMAEGLASLAEADLRLIASLEAASGEDAFARLGFEQPLLPGEGALLASLFVEGSGPNGFEGRLSLAQDGQSIGYFGRFELADNGEISGEGSLDVLIERADGLAHLAGASGASLPGIDANAAISFEGLRRLTLSNIAGVAGEASFDGEIGMQIAGQLPSFTGSLSVDRLDALGIAGALLGGEALIGSDDLPWSEGPLAIARTARPSRGDIAVEAQAIGAGERDLLGNTRFVYSWTPTQVGIDRLEAQVGGGTLGLNLVQCCAGALTDRTISGRLTLAGVDIDALAPDAVAAGLDGVLDAGLQFQGTGASLADVMRAMTGEGNITLAGLRVQGLASSVFAAVARIEDILNTEADALETLAALALAQGDFTAETAQGAFTIAGGTARLANLIVEGHGARLAGSLNLALARLGLDGTFVLTPRDYTDPAGLVQADTARVLARIGGTLAEPSVDIDLGELVAAIQVRANELEVERLEILRQQDAERQRAAAEERNRLIEEQRRRAAAEAARLAAEEEARRLEEERLLQEQLLLNPPVNQPIGTGVNQPIQLIPPN